MHAAARSVQIWMIYSFTVGMVLLIAPNLLLSLFQVAETDEVWVRVVGLVVLAVTIFYYFIVVERNQRMFQATVYGRALVAAGLVALAFTTGPWQLALFGALDAVGSLWTHIANREAAMSRATNAS